MFRKIWPHEIFMGLLTWQKYVSLSWFRATLQNTGWTNNKVVRSFLKVYQIWKRHWNGYLSGKLVCHMTNSLTWLKNAKFYGKRKNVRYFRSTTLHVFPAKLSIFLFILFLKTVLLFAFHWLKITKNIFLSIDLHQVVFFGPKIWKMYFFL